MRRPKQATFPLNIDNGFIVIAAYTSHNAALGNLYSMMAALLRSIDLKSAAIIEYRLPRAALWLVYAAMTINPLSIFSGNVACLGLRKADF